jgi:hypothetical protein
LSDTIGPRYWRGGQRKRADLSPVIAAAYRAQADALEIEALAKRRLADEYDAAQERGEIAKVSDGRRSSKAKDLKPTAADVGLSHKEIHEARQIRDAENNRDPGIVRPTLPAPATGAQAPISYGHSLEFNEIFAGSARSRSDPCP